jgi:hypothetical protein
MAHGSASSTTLSISSPTFHQHVINFSSDEKLLLLHKLLLSLQLGAYFDEKLAFNFSSHFITFHHSTLAARRSVAARCGRSSPVRCFDA